MEEYNFNFEIQNLLAHFASAFAGVKIKRFDGQKYAKEEIKVPFTFSPQSSILQDLVNKAQHVRLPIMSFRISGQGRDNNRIKNKVDDINYRNRDGSVTSLKAIPWNVTGTLSILAKFQEDMDQIIQNFSVVSNPYIVIPFREPKSGKQLRIEVEWDGNITYQYPGDNQTGADPMFRIIADANFTIKGYVFRTNIENVKPICHIQTKIIPTDKFYCSYDIMEEYTKDFPKDEYDLYGRPTLRYVAPFYVRAETSPKMIIQGDGFNQMNAVYLSADNPQMYPMTFHQPSTAFEGFNGFIVPDFTLDGPQQLSFSLPPPSAAGLFNIIAVNHCGIGNLIQDADRTDRVENPYPPDHPAHNLWRVLQFSYVRGIKVFGTSALNCTGGTIPPTPPEGLPFFLVDEAFQFFFITEDGNFYLTV